MPRHEHGDSRVRKRVSNACRRCRSHKIRCSGTHPCTTCVQKGLQCEFGAEDRKVVISESTLHELRVRLHQLEQQQGPPQSQDRPVDYPHTENGMQQQIPQVSNPDGELGPAFNTAIARGIVPPRSNDSTSHPNPALMYDDSANPALSQGEIAGSAHTGVSNPLVPEQPAFISDDSGTLRYLGHSSTWSFSRQVLHMAHQSPHSHSSPKGSVHVEGQAYKIDLQKSTVSEPDIAGLPSIDLSLYYLQTLKFRTCPLFYLFDDAQFTSHLHCFYESPAAYAQKFQAWFVHYLVLMAFAKALSGSNPPTNVSSSFELFSRALHLLPEITQLCEDPVGSTEILCCIALYLQSIDHRVAASIYIGQAMRMAHSHGLHTDLQADVIGPQLVRRGRRIWWTVYALERKLSSSMGVPMLLHDEDLTTPLPDAENSDVSATGQAIHVKICRLLGEVVSKVYRRDSDLNKTYLNTTQTVLRGVAGLANELKVFSERCFGQISRVAAHLDLAYHQCLLLVSRPFLFYILKFRLESLAPNRSFPLSLSAKGLVQVCIDAAMQIITIVSDLRQHDLLDTFLPFDLECAFSAAFVLVMASNLHPKLIPQDNWLEKATQVFDHVSSKGNILGSLRKAEVEELVQTLRGTGQGNKDIDASLVDPITEPASREPSMADQMSLFSLGDPFFDEWIADDGLSGAQVLNLADALHPGGFHDLMLQF